MNDSEFILGLFFSDENNLIYDKIKLSEDLPQENQEKLKMISYKFLGPLFLTTAISSIESWQIVFIESSLSLKTEISHNTDVIQSFFTLNSTIKFENNQSTHLSTLIGSPHTEDTRLLYDRLANYIHPVIIQGYNFNKNVLGETFEFKNFISKELERGINLLEYSLGKPRKMYWEEQNKYYCMGIIERKINNENVISSGLYTFDKDESIRKRLLPFIPSYYIMSILPDYYENLIRETLRLFNRTSISPNIKIIRLNSHKKHVLYYEEFKMVNNIKISYGAILIPEKEMNENAQNISFYRRQLRTILDHDKSVENIIKTINPNFSLKKWASNSEEELTEIRKSLDFEQ